MRRVQLTTAVDDGAYAKKIFTKYKDDTFFIEKYNLIKKQYPEVYLFEVVQAINSQRLCQGCHSLAECSQAHKGYYVSVNDSGLALCACSKKRAQEELKNDFKYLVYTTFDLHEKLPSLNDDIEVTSKRGKLLTYIKKIIQNKATKGVYLSGAPGSGKTFIMLALLNDALQDEKKCALVNVNALVQKLKPLYFSNDNHDKNEFEYIMNKLKKVTALYVDDIGSERADGIVRDEILFPILDYRMQHDLFTCFTSNLKQKELEKQYSITNRTTNEPIKGSRLFERIRVLSQEFDISEAKSRRQ